MSRTWLGMARERALRKCLSGLYVCEDLSHTLQVWTLGQLSLKKGNIRPHDYAITVVCSKTARSVGQMVTLGVLLCDMLALSLPPGRVFCSSGGFRPELPGESARRVQSFHCLPVKT